MRLRCATNHSEKERKMKRFMNVLLALSTAVILSFVFTGCNEPAEQPAKTEQPTPEHPTKTEQPAGTDMPAKGEHPQ